MLMKAKSDKKEMKMPKHKMVVDRIKERAEKEKVDNKSEEKGE